MKRKSSPTIYDIAEELQISPSTVSRALGNSKHPVNEDLRKMIVEKAKAMGYIVNAHAQSLKMQNIRSVGIVVPSIVNPFYPALIEGMSAVASENDYSVYLCDCSRGAKQTEKHIRNMLEQNVQGIITVYMDEQAKYLREFVDRGGQMVALTSRNFFFKGAHNVQAAKEKEAELATEHLISLGHKHIAMMTGPLTSQVRKDKVQGYRNALEKGGIPFNPDYVYIGGEDFETEGRYIETDDVKNGELYVKAMLERTPEVTGIFCMYDMLALGVCSALKKRGYRIPEDYSVIGMDDAFFSAYISPPLTTIGLESRLWGQKLMSYLISILQSEENGKTVVVSDEELFEPISLVVRQSTGAPRKEP